MNQQVLEVAVIGSGFSGLGMGIQLKKQGIKNFKIFEKANDVGGTWRDNTYPGCGCDVKSALYSYSFEPYAKWSHIYAKQGEIHQYIRHCAEKYGMYEHLVFNSAVTAAQFDQDTGLWTLQIADGREVQAHNVVAAPGPFAEPNTAAIEGRDQFKGISIHSARWDHSVDLTGKRVGLIGTGATAVQIGPAIADKVSHLTVFQRTANWIMPRPDRAISDREKSVYSRVPAAMLAPRLGQYWFNELTAPFLILRYDAFKAQPEKIARSYLRKKVKDDALRARLTPNFKFGCKRVLVSSDWFPTMQRDDVTLADQGIKRITETGIETNDGVHHELDVIIYATGYTVRSTGAPFDITGINGQKLAEKWKDGAEAFNGLSTTGFPNMYVLVGPFTGPGHTSVIAYAEKQIDYVCQGILLRQQNKLKYIEVKPEAEARFVDMMDKRSEHTVWKSGCDSWYLSPNGRNNTLYPGFNFEYRIRVARFNPANFKLVAANGKTQKATLGDHLKTLKMALTA
ncbi:MAG: NAD(P)/FAD-dependent oxidoreductase [Moraxellaceae bacterium]|nr:NAD(P)/FAD-dependent oxidoreductase [Moraxellaceae bacterium]MDZ4386969.1 NAD(P)/FAD-dependent oxidoreductase [Moraxellaceae bacterium]